MILYEGPSLLEPKTPIVVVATEDENPKTGRMLFTWILRQDRPPEVAAYDGSDSAICGDCKFRTDLSAWRANIPFPVHTRTCYVRLSPAEGADEAMPPSEVWRLWKEHRNEVWEKDLSNWDLCTFRSDHPDPCWQYRGPLPVRIGSYGDPAAVPTRVWAELVRYAKNWTGYTHFWKPKIDGGGRLNKYACDPDLKRYCMASVDTPEERAEAQALGWRTFFVVPDSEVVHYDCQVDERAAPLDWGILCPATDYPRRGKVCIVCNGRGRYTMPSYNHPDNGPGSEVNIPYECSRCNGTGRVSTTCAVCGLCRGTSARSPSIWEIAHGKNKSNHSWD